MRCRFCSHLSAYKHGKVSRGKQAYFCPACQQTFEHPVKFSKRNLRAIAVSLGIATGLASYLFLTEKVTVGGVPASIILTFLQDDIARNAYFQGNSSLLHNRLKILGVEEDIKRFYNAQISDEVELDQYIHQLLYERTGYVGKQYQVDESGVLVLRDKPSRRCRRQPSRRCRRLNDQNSNISQAIAPPRNWA